MSSKATSQILPPICSKHEIENDTEEARREFRQRRLDQPLAEYNAEYPDVSRAADIVVSAIDELLGPPLDHLALSRIVASKRTYAALRSLAATPISEDDLQTLVDSPINGKALKNDQALGHRVVALLKESLDPQRFPWVVDGRAANSEEIAAAKLATSVLLAVSAVQAGRRGNERRELEGAVTGILNKTGYQLVKKPKNGIDLVTEGPDRGQFMRSCKLGAHNADFVIGLRDGRLLVVECKASNSPVNGFKRLNKEVVGDAADWKRKYGERHVIPAAALRGVFKPENVIQAQKEGVYLFWWHRIDALSNFLAATDP